MIRSASTAPVSSTKIKFFVIGTGRCGTTLVRDILRLHPDIYVPTESHWIPIQYEICGQLRNSVTLYTDIIERVFFFDGRLTVDGIAAEIGASRAELFEATRAALAQETSTVVEFNDALYGVIAAATGRSIIGDKTPDYCAYIRVLQSLWPDAKFIHIIRDGRDVALSMSKHAGYQFMAKLMIPNWVPLAFDKRYAMPNRLTRDPTLEDYISLWNLRLRRVLDDAKRLRPTSYFEIRYENVLHNPRAEIARLAEFLDVSRPQEWLAQVERIVQVGNTNKIRDRAVWNSLTAVAQETLADLGYPTEASLCNFLQPAGLRTHGVLRQMFSIENSLQEPNSTVSGEQGAASDKPLLTQPSPIVVTGMYRSGASPISSILAKLTIDMDQGSFTGNSNSLGCFYEDAGLLKLQRTILRECFGIGDCGYPSWESATENELLNPNLLSEFLPKAEALVTARSTKTLWGWADPRTTLLLSFWDALLQDPRYVLVYRFPWDVANSMQRLGADTFLRHPEYAYQIWNYYNQRLYDFYLEHSSRCVLVSINSLCKNLGRFGTLLRDKLGLSVPEIDLDGLFKSELLTSTVGSDPLIDLLALTSPASIELLEELDAVADMSSSGEWEKHPVSSGLRKPDNTTSLTTPIDLSVVIPCYDHGEFLLEAVASVERTAPARCEVIIVNDGSKQPRTLEILEALRRSGYFVMDQQNEGLSRARNNAIAMASGRYILPLDADNRIREGFVESAIEVLDSESAVGIVYGYRCDFGLRTGVQEVPDFDIDAMLVWNSIDACAVFRKEVWVECGGYDHTSSPLEDWEFWINSASKGWRFYNLHQVTFDYRVRPESLITKTKRAEILQELLSRIMTKHIDLYRPRLLRDLAHIKGEFQEHTYATEALASRLEHQVKQLSIESAGKVAQATRLEQQIEHLCAQATERDSQVASLEGQVKQLSTEKEEKAAETTRLAQQIEHLCAQAAARDSMLESLKDQMTDQENLSLTMMAEKDAELTRITSSLGWRLLKQYGRVKYAYLLPIYRFLGLMPKKNKKKV